MRIVVGVVIAIGALWAGPVAAQNLSDEIWSIHCLSASEQQRIATQFTDALKPYGLNEPDKVGLRVQTLMSEAIETRNKADQCSEAAGDAAPQRCKAQEAAADAAEKRMEKFGEGMEKLEKDLMVIRARYRKC